MRRSCLALVLTCLAAGLLTACVTSHDPNQENMNASGTPSPLNTSANPWTNVNPQIQAQQQAARVQAAQ